MKIYSYKKLTINYLLIKSKKYHIKDKLSDYGTLKYIKYDVITSQFFSLLDYTFAPYLKRKRVHYFQIHQMD